MYKIGDFAKIVGVSIRTLRYYDLIDLFKPDEIDVYTNYRYYSDKKIEEFKIIKELQDVGFTLEEIKKYYNNLNNDVMLLKKQELLNEINIIDNKIKKIDYLRSHIVNGKIELKFTKKNTIKKKSLF